MNNHQQTTSSSTDFDAKKIKIETTNTARVANISPSAASATSDFKGNIDEGNGKMLSIVAQKTKTDFYIPCLLELVEI